MDLSKFILFFVLVVTSVFFYKYCVLYLNSKYPNFLVDDHFKKPQAFHELPISLLGGTGIFISFLTIVIYFHLFFDLRYFDYLSFCTLIFLLGFIDDIKINIKPSTRLVLMIAFLIILIQQNNFYIQFTGIEILNNWLKNSEIFSLIFICLCFLFIINGANLIDGFNGLLGFHALIIFINLFFINYLNGNDNLSNLLFFLIIVLVLFLIFNFPKAKIFLGDGGSYLLGALIAVSAIKTSIENPSISPFYFCILLFYPFFEVFFSFFRKLIKEKTSPIYPDKKHLHMLIYNAFLKKNNNKLKSNYSVSVILNLAFLILLIPANLMMENGMFCKYYSVSFFIIYIFIYMKFYEKNVT